MANPVSFYAGGNGDADASLINPSSIVVGDVMNTYNCPLSERKNNGKIKSMLKINLCSLPTDINTDNRNFSEVNEEVFINEGNKKGNGNISIKDVKIQNAKEEKIRQIYLLDKNKNKFLYEKRVKNITFKPTLEKNNKNRTKLTKEKSVSKIKPFNISSQENIFASQKMSSSNNFIPHCCIKKGFIG